MSYPSIRMNAARVLNNMKAVFNGRKMAVIRCRQDASEAKNLRMVDGRKYLKWGNRPVGEDRQPLTGCAEHKC